ncbi:MAG: hypothetical protein ACK44F_13730 [Roseococcus sp.]
MTPPPLAPPRFPLGLGARRRRRTEPEAAEEDPRRRRRLAGGLLLLAWLLSVGLVSGVLLLLYLFRADVAQAWEPFLRVVQAIGG